MLYWENGCIFIPVENCWNKFCIGMKWEKSSVSSWGSHNILYVSCHSWGNWVVCRAKVSSLYYLFHSAQLWIPNSTVSALKIVKEFTYTKLWLKKSKDSNTVNKIVFGCLPILSLCCSKQLLFFKYKNSWNCLCNAYKIIHNSIDPFY